MTALRDLVEHEEGARFQRLATIIACQKWPRLIASERKLDRGLDAYAPRSGNEEALGLACSLTCSLTKVKQDLQKIRTYYPDVETVIFSTADPVTRTKEQTWQEEVRVSFGVQLHVMGREHLLTSLLEPKNAPLCRNHLRLLVEPSPTTKDSRREILAACDASVQHWLDLARAGDTPLIRLGFASIASEAGTETPGTMDLETLDEWLSMGDRIVLQGPAGGGKTTTLAQLASLKTSRGDPCLAVHLPAWINSGAGLLDFISQSPDFRAQGVEATDLARLSRAQHVDFLFNGWNEVPDRLVASAHVRLVEVDRAYPSAGLLVVTRAGHAPPLPGAARVRVLGVTDPQRHKYLSDVLGQRDGELEALIQESPTLRLLATSPLILAQLVGLYRSDRPIPNTTFAVLKAVTELVQDLEQHRSALEGPPLAGLAAAHLKALALAMTRAGSTNIDDHDARRTISDTAEGLRGDGQVAAVPEPRTILRELCAHHVLEEAKGPGTFYAFQHERLQEFYAALDVVQQLASITAGGTDAQIASFQANYIDLPALEPALIMVADAVAAKSEAIADQVDAITAGAALVEWANGVDPYFAARLARACGDDVWERVGDSLETQYRAWFGQGDEHPRGYAIACILATARPDFADVVTPLVTATDQATRLGAYRAAGGFFDPRSLGADWRTVVGGWDEEQRAAFLTEAVWSNGLVEVAEDFATHDPSESVRVTAMRVLDWLGSDERFERVASGLSDAALSDALTTGFPVDTLPPSLKPRAVAVLDRLLAEAMPAERRLRLAMLRARIDSVSVIRLRDEIKELSVAEIRSLDDHLVESATALLREADPRWTSEWIAEQVAEGGLWGDRWIRRVPLISADLKERLLGLALNQDRARANRRWVAQLLARFGDRHMADGLCQRLIGLEEEVERAGSQRLSPERREVLRQLLELASVTPPSLLVPAFLTALGTPPTLAEIRALLSVIGGIGEEWVECRTQLPKSDRDALRKILAGSAASILAEDDFDGGLMAALALAFGRVGDPEDMPYLEEVAEADIRRVRTGIEDRLTGRGGPAANGAATTQARRITEAITWLGEDAAVPVLLRLLEAVEYEESAASALALFVLTPTQRRRPVSITRDLEPSAQVDEDQAQRSLYSGAISDRIRLLLTEIGEEEPGHLTVRAKRLAVVLASLDNGEHTGLLLSTLSLPGRWDAWQRLDALERIIRRAVRPPSDDMFRVVDAVVEQLNDQRQYNEQTDSLRERVLCVLPFADDPEAGVARLRDLLVGWPLRHYRASGLIRALASSRSDPALELMVELYQEHHHDPRFAGEWVRALAGMDLPKSRALLLRFLDPDSGRGEIDLPAHVLDALAAEIANIARKYPGTRRRVIDLCSIDLSPARRELLGRVVAELGSEAMLLAGLDLMADDGTPPVPYGIRRALRTLLIEHRPQGGPRGVYTLVPRGGEEIRRRLFRYLQDARRMRCATELLAEIDEWRIEYGKPTAEPRHPAFESGLPWPLGIGK